MTMLRAHQQERVPATPPVEMDGSARTVLAGKGSLRRAKSRRALALCAPFWRRGLCDGRLRREHLPGLAPHYNLQNLTHSIADTRALSEAKLPWSDSGGQLHLDWKQLKHRGHPRDVRVKHFSANLHLEQSDRRNTARLPEAAAKKRILAVVWAPAIRG